MNLRSYILLSNSRIKLSERSWKPYSRLDGWSNLPLIARRRIMTKIHSFLNVAIQLKPVLLWWVYQIQHAACDDIDYNMCMLVTGKLYGYSYAVFHRSVLTSLIKSDLSTARERWKIFWIQPSIGFGKFNANDPTAHPMNGNSKDVHGIGVIGRTKVKKLLFCSFISNIP